MSLPYFAVLLLICEESNELLAKVDLSELLFTEEIGGNPCLKGIIALAQAFETGIFSFHLLIIFTFL